MTGEPRGTGDLSTRAATLRLIAFVLAVGAAALLAAGIGPDVATIRSWVSAGGWVAPVVFVLLYTALTVALVPGSVLTIAAGLLFGGGLGTFLAMVGATIGSAIAFAIARATGRRAVERLVSGRAERVDRWLGDRGFLAVVTLRLVPLVPFSIANYAGGVTAVRVRDFLLGTVVGIVPGTVAFTVIGARASDPTDPAFLGASLGLLLLAVLGSLVLRRSNGDGAEASEEADRRPVTTGS